MKQHNLFSLVYLLSLKGFYVNLILISSSTILNIIKLKDSYISSNIERNLYLEKLEIYKKSKIKYDTFYTQYQIVSGLLKDLDGMKL